MQIQSQLENTLIDAEARTVKGYLHAAHNDDDSSGDDVMGEIGFAVDVEKEAVAKNAKNGRRATKYRSVNHLMTTSNLLCNYLAVAPDHARHWIFIA